MRVYWFVIFLLFGCTSQNDMEDSKQLNEWNREGWDIVWQDEFDGASLDLSLIHNSEPTRPY